MNFVNKQDCDVDTIFYYGFYIVNNVSADLTSILAWSITTDSLMITHPSSQFDDQQLLAKSFINFVFFVFFAFTVAICHSNKPITRCNVVK